MVFIHPRAERGFKHSIFGGKGLLSKRVSSVSDTDPWTPAELSTTAWWDASDSSTITESGGSVSQWDDKSGNGYHATQGTAANQPTTNTRILGGLNVLDFDGGDCFDLPVAMRTVTVAEAYFIVAFSDSVSDDGTVYMISDGTARKSGLDFNVSANSRVGIFRGGQNNVNGVDNSIARVYGKTTGNYWIDGTSQGSLTSTLLTATHAQIGARAGARELDGIVAEIVRLDDGVTVDDRQNIEGYLAWKWSGA